MTTKKSTKKVVRFLLDKWLEKIKFHKSIENALMFGQPLVFNKKTGEFSNSIPKNSTSKSKRK